MKGYRFYEEFDSSYKKRRRQGSGNVLALDVDRHGRPYYYGYQGLLECTAAIFSHSNSGVCGTQVSREVLRRNYRRVPEKRAREIHPAMFAFLDQFDENGELRCA